MDKTSKDILTYIKTNPTDTNAYRDLMMWLRHLARQQHTPDLEASRELRGVIGKQLQTGQLNVSQISILGETLKASLTLDGRYDFDCYMQAMEFDRPAEERFWLPRRDKLMRVCQGLQWLEDDPQAQSLSVSLPPRTGKSTICGFGMSWHMARHPLDSNLMVGYSDKLTKHFYKQGLDFATSPDYRYADIFPESPVVWQSAEDEAFSLQKHKSYPSLTCRSIEGTLTGATEVGECGWLYSDDLIADLEEAQSPNRLQNKWDAYMNQAYDRRKTGAKQLMVGTRWDVDDPIGRMYALHAGDPNYRTINVPALDPTTGESNFDYLYNVGFTTQYYLDMKASIDEITYGAKYDQKPRYREGRLYDPGELEYFTEEPTTPPDQVVAVVDTKDKGVDYCVMPVAKQWNGKWYITDVICDNGKPELIIERLALMISKHNVQVARFESNAAGGATADKVQKRVNDMGGLCAVTKKYTTSNKETKILQGSGWVKKNCVFRDSSTYRFGSDYSVFMEQLLQYSLDSKNPHDDAPDAMSMLAELLTKRQKAKASPIKRPF